MSETSSESVSGRSERGLAVALVTLARFIADRDPTLLPYMRGSLEHAVSSSLSEHDVSMLRLLIKSIGG